MKKMISMIALAAKPWEAFTRYLFSNNKPTQRKLK